MTTESELTVISPGRVWLLSHWPDEDDARTKTLGMFSTPEVAHAAVGSVLEHPGFAGSSRSDFYLAEYRVGAPVPAQDPRTTCRTRVSPPVSAHLVRVGA